ncbi:MAG: hypothetical protein IJV50_07360 [Lachnospiraceae bacterium]|nr:hypothetical protein [Lachnospiraceae bacterium]
MKMKIENHIKNGDEHLVSGLPMQMGTSRDREIEKTSKRNKERCAAFIVKMIEKYGREVLEEIDEGKISDA